MRYMRMDLHKIYIEGVEELNIAEKLPVYVVVMAHTQHIDLVKRVTKVQGHLLQ